MLKRPNLNECDFYFIFKNWLVPKFKGGGVVVSVTPYLEKIIKNQGLQHKRPKAGRNPFQTW